MSQNPLTHTDSIRSQRVSQDYSNELIRAVRGAGRTRMEVLLLAAFLSCSHRYFGRDAFEFWLGERGSLGGGQTWGSPCRVELSETSTFQELVDQLNQVSTESLTAPDVASTDLESSDRSNAVSDCHGMAVFHVKDWLADHCLVSDTEKFGSTKTMSVICEWDAEKTTLGFEFLEPPCSLHFFEQFMSSLQVLLQGLTRTHDVPIGQLPITSPEMQNKIVAEFNRPGNDYPRDKSIPVLFEEQVRQRPDSVAIVCGNDRLTYTELNARANQMAHFLLQQGISRGDRVAVCLERSVAAVVTILGILKSEAIYVPLDTSYPIDRLSLILADTAAPYLISSIQFGERFHGYSGHVILIDCWQTTLDRMPSANRKVSTQADDIAYIMYTSGSTGQPKGVQVRHRGIVRLVKDCDYVEISPTDKFLLFASLSFDASTFEIWAPLLNGACLEVFPPGLPSLSELADKIFSTKVTVLWLTAGLFHQMVDYQLDELSSVRQLLAGGDVVSPTHARKFLERARASKLINGYGPTENTTFTCCFTMDSPDDVGVSVSIGRPITNTQVYVMDSAGGILPPGAIGELMIGGDGLALDYLNDPQLTAKKFVIRVVDQVPTRLYHSGDRVRWSFDGTLEFLGRLDRQIKVRGFRVEPGEIELALKEHPSILDAVVQPIEKSGQNQLIAFVTVAPKQPQAASELRNWLSARLPHFMIPTEFVVLDRFPLTANGKIDRKSLLGLSQITARETREYVAPKTDLEIALAEIWRSVLGLDRVGIHDDFLGLGGDSLKAMEINLLLHKNLSILLKPATLLERRTIAEIVSLIGVRYPVPNERHILNRNRNRTGPAKLSSVQQGLWFLDRYEPDSRAYSILFGYRIQGPLDAIRLSGSFQKLVQRHEALRTIIRNGIYGPEQMVLAESPFQLEQIDLTGLKESLRLVEWERQVAIAGQQPFDLERLPLLRAQLFNWSFDLHYLLVSVHHIVFDGWSEGVLFRELNRLYELASDSSPDRQLPALELQYCDYADWQQRQLESEEFGRELAYWKKQLAGAPPVLNLSIARSRPARQSFVGRTKFTSFSQLQQKQIEELGATEGATLYMTLMTAFQVLLHQYSGLDDIVVGTAVANRHEAHFAELIGVFANTLPLRVNMAGRPTFRQLLQQVKQATLDLFHNQTVPMNKLVEELELERHPAWSSIFQVAFVFHNTSVAHLRLPGLVVTRLPVDPGTAKFDLTLTAVPTTDGLQLAWEYNTDLFEDDSIGDLARDFGELVNEFIADPDRKIRCRLRVESFEPSLTPGEAIHLEKSGEDDHIDFDTEAEISRIWKKLLRVDRITRDENFFHIGGHSLLATALGVEIERSFGKKIPIALFFENNTIARQARLLGTIQTEDKFSRLIPLSSDGIGAPVVLLPNIGGAGLTFRLFVDLIRDTNPVFSLQLEADAAAAACDSMESIADRCVDILIESGLRRPIHLAGYSFGGMLTYEVARQLTKRGIEVGVVAIIDSGPSHRAKARFGPLREFVWQMGKNLPGWVVYNLRDPKEVLEKFHRNCSILVHRLQAMVAGRRFVEPNVNPEHIFKMKDKSESERVLAMANLTAFLNYTPGPYAGEVTVVRARVRPLFHSLEPDLGWSQVKVGKICFKNVPGGHKNILVGKQGLLVAQLLRAKIDEYETSRISDFYIGSCVKNKG